MSDVKFDCKTATVTMKGDATLASEAAEKALKDAGFGVTSFSGGPPPSFVVVRATLKSKDGTPIGDADAARIAKVLEGELPALREVFVEPDGRLTAIAKNDAKLETAHVEAAIRLRANVDLADASRSTWPRTATRYIAKVKAADAAARTKARAAAESLDTVAGAIDRRDGTLLVVTKEPCTNLEAKLKEALRGAGVELESVRAGE